MKKILIILFIIITTFSLMGQERQQQKEPKLNVQYKKSYVYTNKSLLVSKSEFDCSFFIGDKIAKDIVIIGAKQEWLGKSIYSNQNEMYINKGSKDGIKEGDVFSVVECGGRVSHPFKFLSSLGTYYGKKSLAVVTCVYENKATVKLKDGCAPVYIGDFLIKYKPEEPILEERVDYRNCRLIKSDINGVVVYHQKFIPFEKRTIMGEDLMVSVDIGNAFLKKGDFLLFYKEFKKDLPPLILGTGIVVSAQKTNSTVKLLKLSNPVSIGDKVTYLPSVKMDKNNGENIPAIGSGQDKIKIKDDDKVLELIVSFKFNEDGISDANKTEIDKIKDFIKENEQYRIVLKGFACNIGKLENNLKLSKQRVESVKKYIIDTLKIDQTLIESYFYGEQDCAFDNTTETSRKKNRRVVITVIGK